MSTAPTLPRVVESQGSYIAPKALTKDISLSYPPLAIQFKQSLDDLYKLFQKTTELSAATKTRQYTIFAKDIDDLIHNFRLWANDISFRTPTREASAAEVLQLLEDTKSQVLLKLQQILQQILDDINQAAIAVSKWVSS